jgi:23S rRNA (uracil1939-C5)-methyltransferase
MKKNDILTVKIESITDLGFGVAKPEGFVIFVSGAVPGDECEIKIIKATPSYAVGRVEKTLAKSKMRDCSRCTISACSSCAYKSISYEYEKKLKEENVRQAFNKAGLNEIAVQSLVGSPKTTEYRNKAQYPISVAKDGTYTVGFYAPKTHTVKEARLCPLAPPIFSQIINSLTAFFQKHSLSVYDEESGKGLLRHIYLRRGEVSEEILLTLVINGASLPHSDELAKKLKKEFPQIVGFLLNVNQKNTNVILGDRFINIYGRDYIYDTLAGVRLKITAPSFYQVNHDAAELLYAKAKELANPQKSDTVLDIYCGAGSIGLSMADAAGELIGIEIIDSAVLCARENAENAGIKNASFFTGDAKSTQRLLENAETSLGRKIKPSVIILDPPRGGCDEELIKFATSLSPKRIVYISCNPTTLARDAAIFKRLGFVTDEVIPFDLFPGTGHVESVVCLTRRLDN